MYRRYIIIGLVFLSLVGAYFAFFYNEKNNKDYVKYYNKLVERDRYVERLDGIDLSIDEIVDNDMYSYIVTFDNVSVRQDNIKVLIVDENHENNDIEYYPSFGILDNKGYSLILDNENRESNEIKGLNLTILDSCKIESLLIYFSGNGVEQFVKVVVGNYLD